jgi:4-hydroxy-tetrahydrodipicolinate synthase
MFSGSMVALVTPMDNAGEVDYSALSRLLDFHLNQGSDALVILGSTGEGLTFGIDEKIEISRFVLQQVEGRIPVVVGVGTNCTKTSIVEAAQIAALQPDALLMICPFYNRPTQAGVIAHFTAIADAVDCPIITYNHPGRTGTDMLPETVAQLAQHDNIVGHKEAVVDPDRFNALSRLANERFGLYSGDDESCLAFLQSGASGVISVVANIVPAQFRTLIADALDGRIEHASRKLDELKSLIEFCGVESNPIAVKWMLSEMGLIDDHLRLPLTSLSTAFHQQGKSLAKLLGNYK